MLITTDDGYQEDTVVYGVGGGDVFLPLSIFSSVLNLDADCSERHKPCISAKDQSIKLELNVGSDSALLNGTEIVFPHKVYAHNGIVMIPIKCISDIFGYTVKDTYSRIHIAKN